MELLHRPMKFRSFDLKSVPFSQGYAAKAIAEQTGASRILGIGDNMGERFSDDDDAGGLLYVRLGYNAGEINMVEAVYLDDGCGVKPMFKREFRNNMPGKWYHFIGGNPECNWVETNFAVVGIDPN